MREGPARFEDCRRIVQEAIDWQITKHMESRWAHTGEGHGRAMDEEGEQVSDLTAYRKRMRDKLLAMPEETLLGIVERYAVSPERREVFAGHSGRSGGDDGNGEGWSR